MTNLRQRLIPAFLLSTLALTYVGYQRYLATRPYEWSGTVEARSVTVGSRAGGRVKQVLAREGQRVTAGQPLVILEAADFEAQKLVAEGQLEQVQANYEKLLKGARPEEITQAKARVAAANAALDESRAGARQEQIAAAQARLAAAQASVDKAQLDADRARKLFASGSISKMEADTADIALRSVTAQRDAQKQLHDELVNGVRHEQVEQVAGRALEARANASLVVAGARSEDIKAAHGALSAAEGKLKSIQLMIDELTIKAPVASRVESLDLRPGDLLGPNAPAAKLIEDGELYIRIYVPETQIGYIHPGDKVPITVDSFRDKQFEGVVEHINEVGEYSPRNLQTADERADQVFATRIGLHSGENMLRAGMAAFIRVPK